jgi:RHS repeat-associated protein
VVVDGQGRIVVGGEKLTDGNYGNYHWDMAVARLHGDAATGVERVYVVQDANFNVTSIIGKNGTEWEVIERYIFDPYGERTVLNADWRVDTDGLSDFNFVHGHQGGRHDLAVGLVDFRNRFLDTSLGRWTRQDPMGYVDGMSQYQYQRCKPTSALDPAGYKTIVSDGGGSWWHTTNGVDIMNYVGGQNEISAWLWAVTEDDRTFTGKPSGDFETGTRFGFSGSLESEKGPTYYRKGDADCPIDCYTYSVTYRWTHSLSTSIGPITLGFDYWMETTIIIDACADGFTNVTQTYDSNYEPYDVGGES